MKIKMITESVISAEKLYVLMLRILLFFMICVPRSMQIPKLLILIVLVIFSFHKKIKWSLPQKELIIIYMLYAVFTTVVGIVKENDISNIIDFIRLNIIYTALFAVVFQGDFTEKSRNKLINTLFHAIWFVSIYSIILLLIGIGIWPRHLFIDLGTANVGIHQGYTHITNTNLSSFLYLLPMIIWMAINNYSNSCISKTKVWITTAVATVVTFASGRRILWLSIVVPIACYTCKSFLKGRRKELKRIALLLVVGVIGLIVLNKTGYFDVFALAKRFLSAFMKSETDWGVKYENVRLIQMVELWKGFLQNPILGAGAGGVLESGYTRSANGVAFEMTYNYILFQSGIVITSFYISFFALMIYRLVKGVKKLLWENRIFLEAITMGFIMAIIGNGTNPYFSSSFDFVWMIYIPFMFLGMVKSEQVRVTSKTIQKISPVSST